MKLDLLNQYTVETASDQNQSQLINMYLEEEQTTKLSQYPYKAFPDPPKGEYKAIAYSMMGLGLFCDTGETNVRALYEQNDVLYVVAGNHFYSVNSAGTKTLLGTLNTSSGFAKITSITGGGDTNNQLVIIDGTNGYHYNIDTSTATFPIADVDFPQTCTDMTSQDDYVIVEKSGSISFYISNVSDATNWAALDFASKIRKPDKLVAVISIKGELWLLGSKTTEIWTNTGNVGFPFERRNDVFIETGCAARSSATIAANSLYYISKSRTGGYGIVEISGYSPLVISTKAVMQLLNSLTSISDAIAYSYAKNGHEFVEWVFPTDNKTIVYDTTNETWLIRQSNVSSVYGRFLGNCAAFCYGKSLIGDYNSGKIYYQSNTLYTENGTPIRRMIVSPPVYNEGKRIYISRLQIDVQTNVGVGTFTLEVSTDRGNTWQTVDTYTVPTSGDGSIYTTSLGSAYCFLFRISTTDNFNFIVLGFQAEITAGNN